MAWGLEARVPFLDKAFLDVSMSIDPKQKLFSKGSAQEFDQDGRPRMEKVYISFFSSIMIHVHVNDLKYLIRKAFDTASEGGKVCYAIN